MLNNISWGDYLTVIGIMTGGYYLVICGIHYKAKIKKIAGINRGEDALAHHEADRDEDDAFAELEVVVEELRGCMLEAAQGISKEELLVLLKEKLINCGGLHRAAYQDALNHSIVVIAEDKCGVVFSEGELNEAWRTLPRQ